jgi:hypothetical protein
MTGLPAIVETGLSTVESSLDALDADLLTGDAPAYEAHCTELQNALLALQAKLASSAVSGVLVSERLRLLGSRLAQQRDNMARRSVMVDKQVQFMLPGLAGATYSRTASAYGAGQRAAGQFTSVKA